MKKIILFQIILLLSMKLFALQGGPDAYGYTWKDSNEPGGPTFHWVDIVTPDLRVMGLGDDNTRGPFNMTIGGVNPFHYYWYDLDKLWIGSNGYVSFSDINLSSIFPPIPDSLDGLHDFITGTLADLTFTGVGNPGKCYYKLTNNNDSIIISYIDVPYYYSSYPYWAGSNTFQIILDKTDYSITINFLSQSGVTLNSDIKTGIENRNGNIGLQPFTGVYPAANYCIKYYYPNNPTYFVKDGATKWNTSYGSGGQFLPYPTTFNLVTNNYNAGNLKISPNYVSTGEIKNFSGTVIQSSPVTFPDTLFIGHDSTFTYPLPFTPGLVGTYSFVSTISNILGDATSSNDAAIQELVVVDTSAITMELNYTDNVADFPGISWSDGMGGLGMYFVPPTYPASITSTKYFIESNPSGAKFIAKIFDDNGPNGMPGTLLDSVMVNSVFVGGYNTVPTSNNIVVYSGGVYVLWEMYGIGITLGRDITPPISYRSFEYVSNIWASYRQGQAEDFLIGLTIQKHQIEDIGTPIVTSPIDNSTITVSTPVTCWLKNYGQLTETTFDIHYQQWGAPAVNQAYSGAPILPGDSVLFTFSTNLAPGLGYSGSFCVWTTKLNDADFTNDSTCITLQTTTGIENTEVNHIISVFPNPMTSTSTVEFFNPNREAYKLAVTDLMGNIVLSQSGITSNKYIINRGLLSNGIYFIQLQGNEVYKGKLVIQ